MKNTELELLVQKICTEQIQMILEKPDSYNSEKYKKLETLKIKARNRIERFTEDD